MTVHRPAHAALVLLLGVAGSAAGQQPNRLANDEPEVRIDARGRNGVCDALLFTPDGSTLLAAGEDKAVHRWAVGADALEPAAPLLWNTFRERRGSIYAVAVDAPRQRVAVAGFGRLNADVAVLDLKTGNIVAALSAGTAGGGTKPYQTAGEAVWALAFRPDGGELAVGDGAGNVWTWQLAEGTATRAVAGPAAGKGSRVAWIGYQPDGRVVFARRDGGVYTTADGGQTPLFRFPTAVGQVRASGDGTRLAATPAMETAAGSAVEVRSLPDGGRPRTVRCDYGRFPDTVALNPAGDTLAVGMRDYAALNPPDRPRPAFTVEPPGRVVVYALAGEPKAVAERAGLLVDQLAFHPDGRRVAAAETLDHGTSVWQVSGATLARVAAAASDTRPVWAVGLTADSRHLCVKSDRDPAPAHPNARAAGAWSVFDLADGRRGWVTEPVQPVPPEDRRDGWAVRFDREDEYKWSVVGPDGTAHPLPWDADRDDLPRCYTFLPGRDGGVWLAVGHLWGVSVFDLRAGQEPRRVRKLAGHAGGVVAVAPTHGGQGLVTAGRDHTVAFWNLADFEHEPLLGAAFAESNGRVTVAADPAPGSPADEAGLARGDVVLRLVVADPARRTLDEPKTPAARLAALRNVRPFVELGFDVSRAGTPDVMESKTSVLHRPAAKFVPLQAGGWVLYTYRQCYYDSSADGDRAVQWLVAKHRADQSPDVFPVGDFRGSLRQPEKVSALLDRQAREPAAPALVDRFPPAVAVGVDKPAVDNNNDPVEVVVAVTPRPGPSGKVVRVERVELWLNDHRQIGVQEAPAAQAVDQPLAFKFRVDNRSLRGGPNRLRALALARDGSWGTTSRPAVVQLTAARNPARQLVGVLAGIDKYEARVPDVFGDLNGAKDAARLKSAFNGLRGRGRFAPDGAGLVLLTDAQVTKKGVLDAIARAGKGAGPDDLFVLGLSGHGVLGDDAGHIKVKNPLATDRWYFATPYHERQPLGRRDVFDRPERVAETFLRDDEVRAALSRLDCPSLLLLDCCHSGQVAKADGGSAMAKSGVDRMRPFGLGPPVVVAACEDHQAALDVDNVGAIFTTAVVDALGRQSAAADRNRDGVLTGDEFVTYVREQTATEAPKINISGRVGNAQTVAVSPSLLTDLRTLVLAEKK